MSEGADAADLDLADVACNHVTDHHLDAERRAEKQRTAVLEGRTVEHLSVGCVTCP